MSSGSTKNAGFVSSVLYTKTVCCQAKSRYWHHELIPSIQRELVKNVRSVVSVMNDSCNPLSDDNDDLYALDTKIILPVEVISAYSSFEKLGHDQCNKFVMDCLTKDTSTSYETVSKNNLMLLKFGNSPHSAKSKTKVKAMKSDVQQFSRLYISCQAREGDLNVFFQLKNQPLAPSLADNDCMHHGQKVDSIECLESIALHPHET